jgi:hypothetical protein
MLTSLSMRAQLLSLKFLSHAARLHGGARCRPNDGPKLLIQRSTPRIKTSHPPSLPSSPSPPSYNTITTFPPCIAIAGQRDFQPQLIFLRYPLRIKSHPPDRVDRPPGETIATIPQSSAVSLFSLANFPITNPQTLGQH